MRFFRGILPNLTIALSLAGLTVLIVARRNPLMGFLNGKPFTILFVACAVCAIATSMVLYASWRQMNGYLYEQERRHRQEISRQQDTDRESR